MKKLKIHESFSIPLAPCSLRGFVKCALVILLVAGLFFAVFTQAAGEEFYLAQVRDVSDRCYEEAVIKLIDNASESIILSMYILKPGDNKRHTVNRLMIDLEEALDRGVKVTIYLNTKVDQRDSNVEDIGRGVPFDVLRNKGARILLVNPRYRLHDKMLIVDSRYVVIGSTNWSISALEDNHEASVLIDSPALAKEQLFRLRNMHLQGESLRGAPHGSLREESKIPEVIKLPCVLLEGKDYLPKMITKHDARAMDLYFLLLRESLRWDKNEFYISMEKMARDLGMPRDWSDSDLRRQVIKSLRKLKGEYGLIDFKFKKARAAYIEIVSLKGDYFVVGKEFIESDYLRQQTQSREFVYLIEAYLKSKGKKISDYNYTKLAEKFHVSRQTIREGLDSR